MNLKSKLSDLARFQTILKVFGKYGFAHFIKDLGFPFKATQVGAPPTLSAPERLRLACEELGPTFIKLGQLLSTRPDLFPEAYIQEFSKLTDRIPAFSFDSVKAIVEKEFEVEIDQFFSSIEEDPLAAASIAQVHRAVLRESGQHVVIKVQRPGIRETIQSDIQILYVLAKALEKIHADFRLLNLTAVVQEFQRSIYEELDFTLEARNLDRFNENFPSPEGVCLPVVIWSATSQRVMTMTEIEGQSLAHLSEFPENIDRAFLTDSLVTFFFESMLFHGFFHADAHPGNVLLINDGRGKLGLLDFGMVGTLSPRLREKISALFVAIVSQDYETLAVIYSEIGEFQKDFSIKDFQADIEHLLSPHLRKPIHEVDIGKLLLDSTRVARKYQVRLPRDLIMFYRALITLDHLGRKLDPNFEFLTYGQRFTARMAKRRLSKDELLKDFWKTLEGLRSLGTEFPLQLKSLVRNLEKIAAQSGASNLSLSQNDYSTMNRRYLMTMVLIVFLLASSFLTFAMPSSSFLAVPWTLTGICFSIWLWILL